MPCKRFSAALCFAAFAAAAPAPVPQVSGYTDADATFAQTPSPLGSLATSFGPDSLVSATVTTPPNGTESGAAPTLVSSDPTGPTSHGPFSGTPTVTGAANGPTTLAMSVGTLPPNPTATYYNSEGVPLNPLPAPYTPQGERTCQHIIFQR